MKPAPRAVGVTREVSFIWGPGAAMEEQSLSVGTMADRLTKNPGVTEEVKQRPLQVQRT